MGSALPPCSFCSRPSTFGPFDGAFVCEKCATRIGDVAWKDAASGVSLIWIVTGRPARPDLADQPPRGPVDVEEASRTFEAVLASGVSGYDAMPHADLARAYEEMGLHSDALREAAIVLDGRTSASPGATRVALAVALSARLLKPQGLTELKSRLRVAPSLH
jgi:hypothetical protein